LIIANHPQPPAAALITGYKAGAQTVATVYFHLPSPLPLPARARKNTKANFSLLGR